MDEADRARITSDRHLAEAMAGIKKNMPTGESHTHCADCGEPIPQARRMAAKGCARCAECQAEHEQLERRMM